MIVVRARAALIARALELLTTDSSLWSFIKKKKNKKKKNPRLIVIQAEVCVCMDSNSSFQLLLRVGSIISGISFAFAFVFLGVGDLSLFF